MVSDATILTYQGRPLASYSKKELIGMYEEITNYPPIVTGQTSTEKDIKKIKDDLEDIKRALHIGYSCCGKIHLIAEKDDHEDYQTKKPLDKEEIETSIWERLKMMKLL